MDQFVFIQSLKGPLSPSPYNHCMLLWTLMLVNVRSLMCHDDVIKWKHFPRNWPFVRGIHRSPVNSPHKGQRRVALMFSLICVWINDWVNNGEAGDLRRYRAHYDVIVMQWHKGPGFSYPVTYKGNIENAIAYVRWHDPISACIRGNTNAIIKLRIFVRNRVSTITGVAINLYTAQLKFQGKSTTSMQFNGFLLMQRRCRVFLCDSSMRGVRLSKVDDIVVDHQRVH